MTFYLLLLPVLLALVVLQHSLGVYLAFNLVNIEVSLALVIFAALRMDVLKGAVATGMAGFLMDCLCGTPSGFYMTIYYVVFCLFSFVSPRLYTEERWTLVLITFVGGLMEGFLLFVMSGWVLGKDVSYDLWRFFLPQLVLVSLISPFLFQLFEVFFIRMGGYERSLK
ncbi:MAG TPA: hypothetical protein PK836_02030 [Syntrophales bacterium]|nr:hypothetical protein [Syntrophales bacterium]HOM07115.1 hypothetical protein [Syntrophales bacterium]HOO00370.1 hypothetical protein [Syntrophales bacterium]HPC00441.1 hypothetical protein [Syntrophales bacterium]HPQ05524.1 hypothetical protein [Syntrophales bacterium]